MKIGIIGGGVVGRATARCWIEHVDEVRVFDLLRERQTHDYITILECDVVFVCLPEAVVQKCFAEHIPTTEHWHNRNFVLRSTVPIGTTKQLQQQFPNLVHYPEFLTERCANTDAQLPSRNVVGLPDMKNQDCARLLVNLLDKRFPGVPSHIVTSDESEAIKLMTNAFFTVKISLMNEFRSLCDAKGMDWERTLQGILSDGRIAHSHTKVPGPDGKRGFGGKCLGKDARQLLECYLGSGALPPKIIDAALSRNKDDRPEGE